MSRSDSFIGQVKTLSLMVEMTESGINDELAVLQRQLEKYQKYRTQHPELYDDISLNIVISPALLRTCNLYFYFIPFHFLFHISVMINAKSTCCYKSLHNIRSLMENNITVSTLISH